MRSWVGVDFSAENVPDEEWEVFWAEASWPDRMFNDAERAQLEYHELSGRNL